MKCEGCGKDLPEMTAEEKIECAKEFEKNFGYPDTDTDNAVICDGCYQEFLVSKPNTLKHFNECHNEAMKSRDCVFIQMCPWALEEIRNQKQTS